MRQDSIEKINTALNLTRESAEEAGWEVVSVAEAYEHYNGKIWVCLNVRNEEEGSKTYEMIFWPGEYDSVSMLCLHKVEVV